MAIRKGIYKNTVAGIKLMMMDGRLVLLVDGYLRKNVYYDSSERNGVRLDCVKTTACLLRAIIAVGDDNY